MYIPIRIIRDAYYSSLHKRNFLELHGSSIALDGMGILIMGDKSAGKTTTMLKFLNRNFGFISNDKSFISFSENTLIGFPFAMNIYNDSISVFPLLSGLFSKNNNDHYQHKEWVDFKNRESKNVIDIM